jgi:hypothetical protein
LVDTLVGGVVLVQEIHHYNVITLAVAMTPANTLLDALRGRVVHENNRP